MCAGGTRKYKDKFCVPDVDSCGFFTAKLSVICWLEFLVSLSVTCQRNMWADPRGSAVSDQLTVKVEQASCSAISGLPVVLY